MFSDEKHKIKLQQKHDYIAWLYTVHISPWKWGISIWIRNIAFKMNIYYTFSTLLELRSFIYVIIIIDMIYQNIITVWFAYNVYLRLLLVLLVAKLLMYQLSALILQRNRWLVFFLLYLRGLIINNLLNSVFRIFCYDSQCLRQIQLHFD